MGDVVQCAPSEAFITFIVWLDFAKDYCLSIRARCTISDAIKRDGEDIECVNHLAGCSFVLTRMRRISQKTLNNECTMFNIKGFVWNTAFMGFV